MANKYLLTYFAMGNGGGGCGDDDGGSGDSIDIGGDQGGHGDVEGSIHCEESYSCDNGYDEFEWKWLY